MPREIIRLAESQHNAHIRYISIIAYPDDNSKRQAFAQSCIGWVFKCRHKSGELRRSEIPKEYRKMKNEKILGVVNSGLRRLRVERMYSAHYACSYLLDRCKSDPDWERGAKDGLYENKVSDISSWKYFRNPRSRSYAAQQFLDLLDMEGGASWLWNVDLLEGEADTRSKNMARRYWRNSRPVLHLFLSLPFNLIAGSEGYTSLHEMLQNHSWLPITLRKAEVCRVALPSLLPQFDEADTIQVIPA
jgi:hypothetical protein